MRKSYIIIIIILFLITYISYDYYDYYKYKIYFDKPRNYNVPKIIHLIYIPWDKNQKLKDNYLDFDKKSYEDLRDNNKDYQVKLWTLPDIKNFLSTYYPDYYDLIFNLPRPTMIVDFMRLLVVYHYGGIYWQYGSRRRVKTMDYFLPEKDKKVRLFTESIITQKQSKYVAEEEEIRDGEPEELIRVCNQVFSAEPKHPYILTLFLKAISNSKKYKVIKDYDILYIGANAMMSKVYNEVGRYDKDVELVDKETVKRMINISSKGSWRTDKNKGFLEKLKTYF